MLAVSGGVDSMVLLHAVAAADGGRMGASGRIVVATFDHGTGPHAQEAVRHVLRWSEVWGVPVVSGDVSGARSLGDEASWRRARWTFLRRVAREHGGAIVTAHTRDDHLETIVMRAMRGAGARGLSALRAPSPIRRPLLVTTRDDVLAYARAHGVPFLEDPSNASRRHFRNRVRLDLLPAMRRVSPTFDGDFLALADRAAALRRRCSEAIAPYVGESGTGRVVAELVTDASWPPEAAALYWQSVAEVAGIALDWRGTTRLTGFAIPGRGGRRIPLSGGYEAVHRGERIELRRRPALSTGRVHLALCGETQIGAFRFSPASEVHPMPELRTGDYLGNQGGAHRDSAAAGGGCDPWTAWLPADAALEVRAWRAGDRMHSSGGRLRRVKRFLADRRVSAPDREGWPVVVADGEIVWIPGVRRGHAATVRPGRPSVCFVCERLRQ